ncbi:thiol:disulfide interchange protein DsbG [Azohydromonas lata]|uniref:thiol:disulfide interchange protein DsbG n=1 Tax=Azohydromonas lata TaxID=45677 RepID=UPI0008348423|nr:thiol:disulfide interchange protein DsbG [Azohydromonas lata]
MTISTLSKTRGLTRRHLGSCLLAAFSLGWSTASPAQGTDAAASREVWAQLGQSRWIADGRDDAPRKVYVFTDPNCPFCAKFWADARPWVDKGKVQLRHVIVGILTPTSAGRAAALLSAADPVAALAAHERAHAGPTQQALATGTRPRPLGEAGVKPLFSVPAAVKAQLDANATLMAAYGLQATPAAVWLNDKGQVQARQGIPDGALARVLGPE